MDTNLTIDGIQIQHDASGVGQCWKNVSTLDISFDAVENEIEAEILDGSVYSCEDYVASNGQHYRWSV